MKTLFRLFLILGFLCVFLTGFPFPKKLWIYWDQPIEKAPLLIRLCYEKFKFVCEKENWELNMLSEDMLPNYIDDYNTFLEIIKNAKTPFRQNRGDLVRFSLLDDHGGVYIDISTILIYGLKWLEEMQKFPYLFTNMKSGFEPDLLASYVNTHQAISQTRGQFGTTLNEQPGFQLWFIAAKAKSPIISQWRKWFSYFYQRYPDQKIVLFQEQDIHFRNIEAIDFLNGNKAMYYLLQRKQLELDKQLGLFSERKSALDQYKIWGFHEEIGPLVFYYEQVPNRHFMYNETIEELNKQFVDIKFCIKLTHEDRGFADQVVIPTLNFQQQLFKRNQTFQDFINSKPNGDFCNWIHFPLKGSVIGDLLEQNPLAEQRHYFSVSREQQNRWKQYCSGFIPAPAQKGSLQRAKQKISSYISSIEEEPKQYTVSGIFYNAFYEKDLTIFQKIAIVFKSNVLLLKIYLHVWIGFAIFLGIYCFNRWFISINLIKRVFRIVPNQSSALKQGSAKLDPLFYIMMATNFFTIAFFQMFDRYVDVNNRTFNCLIILATLTLRIIVQKRIPQTSNVLLGLRLKDFEIFVNPIVDFAIGKMVLRIIQIRSNYLDPHSFLICLLCPYLLRIASIYKSTQHVNVLLRLILDLEPYFRPMIMIFVVICRLTNLQYIVIGQHYAVRKLVYLLLAFTMALAVSVFYQTFRFKFSSKNTKLATAMTILERIIFTLSVVLVFHFCYIYRFKYNEYKAVWLIDHKITKFFVIYFVLSSVNILRGNAEYLKTSSFFAPIVLCLRTLVPFSLLIVVNFSYEAQNIKLFTERAFKWTWYIAIITILNQFTFYQNRSSLIQNNQTPSNWDKTVQTSQNELQIKYQSVEENDQYNC